MFEKILWVAGMADHRVHFRFGEIFWIYVVLVILGEIWLLGLKSLLYFLFLLLGLHFLLMFILFTAEKTR